MPAVQRLFEISFVDVDDPFFQLDNLPVYKLYARTVEYSDERLDTGIDAIDNIELPYTLVMNCNGSSLVNKVLQLHIIKRLIWRMVQCLHRRFRKVLINMIT